MKTLDEFFNEKFNDPEFLARWEEGEIQDEQAGMQVYRCDLMRRLFLQERITKTVPQIIQFLLCGVRPAMLADIYGISLDQANKLKELGIRLEQNEFSDVELAKWFYVPWQVIKWIREELYPLGLERTALIPKERRNEIERIWSKRKEMNEEEYQKWFGNLTEEEQDLINVLRDRSIERYFAAFRGIDDQRNRVREMDPHSVNPDAPGGKHCSRECNFFKTCFPGLQTSTDEN